MHENTIYWHDRHLYIEQAPEPNDIVILFDNIKRTGNLSIALPTKD